MNEEEKEGKREGEDELGGRGHVVFFFSFT